MIMRMMTMMVLMIKIMMMMRIEQMACGVSLAAEAGTQLSALQLHWPAACYYTGTVMVMRRRGRRSLLLYWDCDDDDPKTQWRKAQLSALQLQPASLLLHWDCEAGTIGMMMTI